MQRVRERGRDFYESPALIGCALAVSRELYDRLWGFDTQMRMWGVEDLDFGLKCWLMGNRILHDPEAAIGHCFRSTFDNYTVPAEHGVVNQLRAARKHFTHGVWSEWVEICRQRNSRRLADHPEGLWARVWEMFQADRALNRNAPTSIHSASAMSFGTPSGSGSRGPSLGILPFRRSRFS
jgi:GT2 family glycosyltransferase